MSPSVSVPLISSFQLFCTLFFIPLVEEVAVCTHRGTAQEEHKILPFYRCTNKAPVCARNKPSFIWHPASCTHFNLCYFPKCIQIFMSLFLPLPFTLLFSYQTHATGSFVTCTAQCSEETSSASVVSLPNTSAVLVSGTNSAYRIKCRQ